MADGNWEQLRARLSKHEWRVLQELATGASNHQIAARMRLSENTVEKYLSDIYLKLGVRSRSEAIAWYYGYMRWKEQQSGSS